MSHKTIEMQYDGELRCRATHVRSNTELVTDAPIDNNGKGSSFSPTDLVAAALGSCMMTIIGIAAQRAGLNVDGMRCSVIKVMKDTPRRISKLVVEITMPQTLEAPKRKLLERVAKACPVAQSLSEDLEQEIIFSYAEVRKDKS